MAIAELVDKRVLYPKQTNGRMRQDPLSGAPSREALRAKIAWLDSAGVPVPDAARKHLDIARDLENFDGFGDAARLDEGRLIAELATGEVAPDDLAEQMGRTPDALKAARALVAKSATHAVRLGIAGLRERTDDEWAAILNEALAEALDTDDEDRYAAVRGAASVILVSPDGATARDREFGRPDAVWRWQLENAKDYRAHRVGYGSAGTVELVELTPREAPNPDLATVVEHRAAWRPGVFTAQQVLDNLAAIRPVDPDDLNLPEVWRGGSGRVAA